MNLIVRLPFPSLLLMLGCSTATGAPPQVPSSGTAGPVQLSVPHAPPPADAPIDAAARARIIDVALKDITDRYVDPPVAAKIEAAIRAHQKHGDYDRVVSSIAFAKLLSAHFFEIAHDRHLSIRYTARALPPEPTGDSAPDPALAAAAEAAEQASNRFTNGGFDRVERFAGNIGYLKFNHFAGPWIAGETATYALSFVADAEALIVDLRDNMGGYPQMVGLIASYLFDGWPVQLSSLYSREDGATTQAWTTSFVPGKRFGKDKPVYILTSDQTFSGAEALAYDLQALKRATIVGETTGGGANPGSIYRVADHFDMQIASGRAVNPVTKTNWEGTGVKPDIAVRADLSLATARLLALQGRAGKTDDPEQRDEIASATREAQADLDRLKREPPPKRATP